MGRLFDFDPGGASYLAQKQVHDLAGSVQPDHTWNGLVVEPLRKALAEVIGFIPDIVVASWILLIGLFAARILQFIVSRFLRAIGFDQFAKKIGLTEIIAEGDKPVAPHVWAGGVSFWLTVVVSLIMALDQLRLNMASSQLDHFLFFFVTVFTTLITFVFGMFLSFIFSRLIQSFGGNLKMPRVDLWTNAARWTIMGFTVIICLGQIGMPPQVLLMAVAIAFVTLCITFILAFGMGGVGWAGKVLDKTLK